MVYQPQPPQSQPEWTHPAQPVPHPEQGDPTGGREAEGEGDSGFQEAGLCVGLACSPLVSPERAKGAMMLGSSRQMVPMVGAQLTPLSDELSATYKEKARQASEYTIPDTLHTIHYTHYSLHVNSSAALNCLCNTCGIVC